MSNENLPANVQLYFPYPTFREGQLQAIKDIYENVSNNNHVILEARNGFGKTLSEFVS
ncbi:MAG: hypothetical protein ACTSVY_00510 [Candidatus Helarchaeota archaeon]